MSMQTTALGCLNEASVTLVDISFDGRLLEQGKADYSDMIVH